MAEARVPDRFRRAVLLHLFRNLDPAPDRRTPLTLGLHGPSGEGKTFQCRVLLDEIGAKVVAISGGQLESPDAGAPAALIRRAYDEASAWRARGNARLCPAALLIDDVDTALGDWGERVQYTVNRQAVIGELMHLADFPCSADGRRRPRVPIVLTGNDFTKLYPPLVRLGRMRLFGWAPTMDEKLLVIGGLYPELSTADAHRLLAAFSEEPVTFFAQLRCGLADEAVWSYIQSTGVQAAFGALARGLVPRVRVDTRLNHLIALGRDLVAARLELRDHVFGKDSHGDNQSDDLGNGLLPERSGQGPDEDPAPADGEACAALGRRGHPRDR